MDPVKAETPVESTEAAKTSASFSEIHEAIMAEGQATETVKADAVKAEAKEPAQAKPASQPSGETKEADEPKAAVPSEDEGVDKEKAEPDSKAIPKHEREKFRLRKQRDAAEKRAKDAEDKLREMGVGEEQQAQPVDPEKQAEFRVKTAISKKNFIKTYGEEKLKELVGEDSTWIEIEERAKAGEPEAVRLHQRALDSDDPFEEIQGIVEDERIFDEYGTRSVAAILAQALEQQSTDLEKRLQAEHAIRQPKTGKAVKTLGVVPGKTPEAQKVEEDAAPTSIREFYGVS